MSDFKTDYSNHSELLIITDIDNKKYLLYNQYKNICCISIEKPRYNCGDWGFTTLTSSGGTNNNWINRSSVDNIKSYKSKIYQNNIYYEIDEKKD